jgi:hypothetical protein
MNNTGIIYKVTSPSGKVYIGQTIQSLHIRRLKHESTARCNNRREYKSKFSCAIRKYGNKLKWEVLHNHVPLQELDVSEETAITKFNSYTSGYNMQPTAQLNRRGIAPWNKGLKNPYSIKSLIKRSESLRGKIVSPETRYKMRLAKLGRKLTIVHKAKISLSSKGRVQKLITEATRQKLVSSHKDKRPSAETRTKMRLAQQKRRQQELDRSN